MHCVQSANLVHYIPTLNLNATLAMTDSGCKFGVFPEGLWDPGLSVHGQHVPFELGASQQRCLC